MSTKIKKLYSSSDIQDAKKDSEKVVAHFTRKSERRQTVQVRVSKVWHAELKKLAQSEKLVISFLLDEMCRYFFKNYADYIPSANKIRQKSRKEQAKNRQNANYY